MGKRLRDTAASDRRAAASALSYQSGFGSELASEALPGALPQGQNSPQRVAYGLYAEQFSGTAFTAPRHQNRRSWLYRLRPALAHGPFHPLQARHWLSAPFDAVAPPPSQWRWDPLPLPAKPTDFIEGLVTFGGNGDAALHTGIGIHLYACNRSMRERYFYNADGELLLVPQQGALRLATEFGAIELSPGEVALIPRGVRFQVALADAAARGYVAENYGAPLRLSGAGGRLRGPRRRFRAGGEVRRPAVERAARSLAARRRRLARQSRPVQIRPRALQQRQQRELRPSRPVDLHGVDLAIGRARHGEHGLRDLPAALDRRRAHLPAAVVPSQRDERVHGAHPRRL
jgi:hypothetical protein